MRIAEHLHFEVLDPRNVAFEKHVGAAERRRRFAAGLADPREQLRRRVHHAHAAAAAAEARLDDDGKPDGGSGRQCRLIALDRGLGAGHGGHAGLGRQALGRRLVAEGVELLRCRPDKAHAGGFETPRELRAL